MYCSAIIELPRVQSPLMHSLSHGIKAISVGHSVDRASNLRQASPRPAHGYAFLHRLLPNGEKQNKKTREPTNTKYKKRRHIWYQQTRLDSCSIKHPNNNNNKKMRASNAIKGISGSLSCTRLEETNALLGVTHPRIRQYERSVGLIETCTRLRKAVSNLYYRYYIS